VTIHELTLLAHTPTTLTLDISCSAGTYIRSLAHDLGEALGTVAHLAELRRSEVGAFTLADAYTLPAIEAAAEEGKFQELLLPLGAGLGLPILPLDEATALRLSQGQRVVMEGVVIEGVEVDADMLALAQSSTGSALGVVRCLGRNGDTSLWKAEKWLAIA
jgi:tRNA pseudouridine55 synthase